MENNNQPETAYVSINVMQALVEEMKRMMEDTFS